MSDQKLNLENISRHIVKAVMLTIVIVVTILFVYFVIRYATKTDSWIVNNAKEHFAAIIGIPFVAMATFFIVAVLDISFGGNIEFEGLGFKFRGASGPIVLWVLCFLVICLCIRMLW